MSLSNAYFAEVAEQWEEMRSGYFTEHMRDAAIARAGLPTNAIVADVGTGTGFVVRGLTAQAARVFGFDASLPMLAEARRNLGADARVHLQQATGDRLPAASEAFDAVFTNMYLHHAPDPAAAIREMVRLLKPGGVLCVTDLDAHDHEWQREQMADLWLGFERDEIMRWFNAAGLHNLDVDCAEGDCCAVGPDGAIEPLSVFVAIGRKLT